jgi:hypothetical protein
MLTDTYIEDIPVDEELAGQVWGAWNEGEIDYQAAWLAWWLIFESLTSLTNREAS